MTQSERILDHLRKYKTITQKEASDIYGCSRLAARISDLREAGHIIYTDIVSGKNRYGEVTHFASYRLEEPDA